MKRLIALLICFISVNSYAGISAIVIAYGTSDIPVNSSIDVDAEYVAMSVSLESDAKSPAERANLINQAHTMIKDAANKHGTIEYQQGMVSLSPREDSSFSLMKSSYGRNSSESNFYLLSRLGEGRDIFSVTQELYKFMATIHRPSDTSIRLGNTTLAVQLPDSYRNELLKKIKTEIASIKQTMGSNYTVTVSGLEGTVLVRQKNDTQVTMFIDYRLDFKEE